MKSDAATSEVGTTDLAIVGAGFSGTMIAAQLARRGLSSVLVEGHGRAGNDIARELTA